eukprot:Ihof_evm2s152 gene=Ihof_evmTU2s152
MLSSRLTRERFFSAITILDDHFGANHNTKHPIQNNRTTTLHAAPQQGFHNHQSREKRLIRSRTDTRPSLPASPYTGETVTAILQDTINLRASICSIIHNVVLEDVLNTSAAVLNFLSIPFLPLQGITAIFYNNLDTVTVNGIFLLTKKLFNDNIYLWNASINLPTRSLAQSTLPFSPNPYSTKFVVLEATYIAYPPKRECYAIPVISYNV